MALGTRSFRDVFAHIAAETRLRALPDDQLITAMDRAMEKTSASPFADLSRTKIIRRFRISGKAPFPGWR